jgi:hypothetical protein
LFAVFLSQSILFTEPAEAVLKNDVYSSLMLTTKEEYKTAANMAALDLWGIDFKDTEPVFNENEETVTLAYFNPEKDYLFIIVFENGRIKSMQASLPDEIQDSNIKDKDHYIKTAVAFAKSKLNIDHLSEPQCYSQKALDGSIHHSIVLVLFPNELLTVEVDLSMNINGFIIFDNQRNMSDYMDNMSLIQY